MQYLTVDLAIFIAIQLVNVIVSTIKSILTVNGSPLTASVWNSVSYTLGAVVTKMLTQQSFEVIIVVSMLTNLLGVYIAKVIIEKARKDHLYTINATLRCHSQEFVESELQRRGIQYTLLPAVNDRMLLCAFSYSKAESAIVKEILDHENVRFTVTDSVGGN